ncbi:hypothetical protein BD309DRAFT_950302 [Dichomitus squalens]|nr:hypothetical protein BD309DRAFT_950302 [Dichomitus squalens]
MSEHAHSKHEEKLIQDIESRDPQFREAQMFVCFFDTSRILEWRCARYWSTFTLECSVDSTSGSACEICVRALDPDLGCYLLAHYGSCSWNSSGIFLEAACVEGGSKSSRSHL